MQQNGGRLQFRYQKMHNVKLKNVFLFANVKQATLNESQKCLDVALDGR